MTEDGLDTKTLNISYEIITISLPNSQGWKQIKMINIIKISDATKENASDTYFTP